ncbi:hypothetical protein [Luteitalea sp.]|uniref:hypothetical protein n=1 Tax=Luteitalea sp. TaxID=2004800 RepID=UPI0037C6807D
MRASRKVLAAAVLLLGLVGCAPKVLVVTPAGAGTAMPDLKAAQAMVDAACTEPVALTADLRLSGRIEGDRVRGTLQVGVSVDSVRLEGLAPFGAPVFVLAGRPGQAILLLPRDPAVARGASPADLLDAVVGVPFGPADLRALIAGCGFAGRTAREAATFPGGWTRVAVEGPRVIWLRAGTGGRPVVVAASDGTWEVSYTRADAGWPTAFRVRRVAQGPDGTDAAFAVDAPEALEALPAGALDVAIPAAAREVTVADLRNSRALRER